MTSPPSAPPPPSEPWQPYPRPAAAAPSQWTGLGVAFAVLLALLGLFFLACIIGTVVVFNSLGGSNK